MTNEVIQNILTRCSVRAYDDRPVEREKIDTLLQCAVHLSLIHISEPTRH